MDKEIKKRIISFLNIKFNIEKREEVIFEVIKNEFKEINKDELYNYIHELKTEGIIIEPQKDHFIKF